MGADEDKASRYYCYLCLYYEGKQRNATKLFEGHPVCGTHFLFPNRDDLEVFAQGLNKGLILRKR
jgi:hypothetical protein